MPAQKRVHLSFAPGLSSKGIRLTPSHWDGPGVVRGLGDPWAPSSIKMLKHISYNWASPGPDVRPSLASPPQHWVPADTAGQAPHEIKALL